MKTTCPMNKYFHIIILITTAWCVSRVCVQCVCGMCVWSAVRFQFRGSSACKMDQRSARFTDPTTHPCHVAMPGQIPNQSIAASARTHTHTRVHMRRLLWHSRTPWPGPEVLAISRDKQLARAVRRKQILTAVGHLEASRGEHRKTHLEKGSTEHMLEWRGKVLSRAPNCTGS